MTVGGSAEEPVIIIDDLSSSEDEVNPDDKSIKDNASSLSPSKQLSLEPDTKKQKLFDIGDISLPALPAPIVDDALLSSIPMPSQPPSMSSATVECKYSPVKAEEKSSPVPIVLQEQHSTPVEEQKTSPASVDQYVTFRRLTELPMPPMAPDDECESPSENSR